MAGLPGSAARAARRQAELDEQAAVEARLRQMRIEQLVAERLAAGTVPARKASPTASVRRMAWRGRRVLLPFPVLIGLLIFAGAVGRPDGPGGFATFLTAALCAAGWWALRGRRRLRRRDHVRYAAGCLAAAVLWLTWTAATRLEVTALWGVLTWAAGSTPWWWRHWPSDRLPTAENLPAPTKPSIPDLWADNVAAEGGAAPKSVLYAPSLTKNGRAFLVQLDPGKQDLADLRGKLSKLATGLRTPMEQIVIDDETGSEDPSIIRLQIIDKSPIKKTVWFTGPRWAKGMLHLGLHADGDGAAQYRLYTDDGSMWGGFILGGTGSGKSRLLEAIAVTVRAMSADGMPTSILYLDGQSGASSAAIADNATWFRGRDGGMTVLRALERAMARRNAWNRRHRMMKFFPGHKPENAEYGLPGILVIVDECHRIFTDIEIAQRWSNVAREGRKLGIAILAASQHCGLQTFGGSEELRSSLFTGNLIVMRTKSNTAVNMLGELGGIDPTTFPKLPGYGYKIAEDGDDERSVPFRGDYLPDDDDAEKYLQRHGEPVPVPTVDDWFDRTADADIDEMTAAAFGPAFLDRHTIEERMHEDAAALMEGRIPAIVEPDPTQPPPAGTPRLVPVADLDEDDPEDEEQADTTRQLILQLLAEGSRTKKELEKLTGKSDSSVKQALRKLVEDGGIERLSRGVYALANTEAAV